jgi:hypothetical protein
MAQAQGPVLGGKIGSVGTIFSISQSIKSD